MPADEPPVAPAMTPEEWRATERWRDERGIYVLSGVAEVAAPGDDGLDVVTVAAEDLPALMAFANHALPDGHAAKITRAMVEELDASADCDEEAAQMMGSQHPSPLRAIAAALRSLLPPEPTEPTGLTEPRPFSGVVLAPVRLRSEYEVRTDVVEAVQAIIAAHDAGQTIAVAATFDGEPVVDGPCRVVSCKLDPFGNVRAVVEDQTGRRLTITGRLPDA